MTNSTWALILILMLALMTVFARYVNRESSLVVICHNVVWAGAILLVGTNLIQYKQSTSSAWLILACGLIFFNLGALFAKLPGSSVRAGEGLDPHHVPKVDSLLSRRALFWLLAFYSCAFGLYLLNISHRFGLSVLLADPASIRGFHGESYLESVPLVVRIFLYLGPLLFVVFGYRESLDRPFSFGVRVVGMLLLAASMIALLQRTNLFMALLWLVALILSRRTHRRSVAVRLRPRALRAASRGERQPRRRRIVLPIVAAGVLMFFAFQLLGGALGKTGQQALSTGAVSTALAKSGLTSPYGYYASGAVAFLQLTESTDNRWPPEVAPGALVFGDYNPQTWGAATFSALLRAIPGAKPWPTVQPFINTGVLTNVYTWLSPFYRDFRLTGVVVAMFLMGLIATRLYVKRFSSTRVYWIQGAVLSTILLAPFTTRINSTLWLVGLAFIILLTIRRPLQTSRPAKVLTQVKG